MRGKARRVARPVHAAGRYTTPRHRGPRSSESGDTVTECAFLPLVYFRGYFQGIGIADFLLWLSEHHVGNFGQEQLIAPPCLLRLGATAPLPP